MKTVDLPTSQALQELGYNGEFDHYVEDDGSYVYRGTCARPTATPAPRLDDAAYWLRERHGLLIYITYLPCSRLYCPHIADMMGHYESSAYYPAVSPNHDTALDNAVKNAIEIIKDKKL